MFLRKKEKEVIWSDTSLDRLDQMRVRAQKKYDRKVLFFRIIPPAIILCISRSLLGLLFAVIAFVLCTMIFDHRAIYHFDPRISIWFGVPGSGKTSMAAWLSRASRQIGYPVLSNVELKDCYILSNDDLGTYDMSFDGTGAHVIIDEATLSFDGRNFKDFAKTNAPAYFALHRHMLNRVDVFSQGYDIDKRIRDRAGSAGLFYLKKFPLPGIIMYRKIKKVLFIKKEDKQMIDGFSFSGLPRLCNVRSVWDSFDTLDTSLCPTAQKQWQKWGEA